MKIRSFYSLALTAASIVFGSLAFSSCSDPVKGCTDPLAESYNANADEADASLCVYSRDKFIGSYTGSLVCPGTLNGLINQPTYEYSIAEKAGGDVNAVDINATVSGAPVKFSGTVSGTKLTVNQLLPNLPFTVGPGTTATVNITVTGEVNIANEKTLSGNLTLAIALAANGAPLGSDTCPITGTKK